MDLMKRVEEAVATTISLQGQFWEEQGEMVTAAARMLAGVFKDGGRVFIRQFKIMSCQGCRPRGRFWPGSLMTLDFPRRASIPQAWPGNTADKWGNRITASAPCPSP